MISKMLKNEDVDFVAGGYSLVTNQNYLSKLDCNLNEVGKIKASKYSYLSVSPSGDFFLLHDYKKQTIEIFDVRLFIKVYERKINFEQYSAFFVDDSDLLIVEDCENDRASKLHRYNIEVCELTEISQTELFPTVKSQNNNTYIIQSNKIQKLNSDFSVTDISLPTKLKLNDVLFDDTLIVDENTLIVPSRGAFLRAYLCKINLNAQTVTHKRHVRGFASRDMVSLGGRYFVRDCEAFGKYYLEIYSTADLRLIKKVVKPVEANLRICFDDKSDNVLVCTKQEITTMSLSEFEQQLLK